MVEEDDEMDGGEYGKKLKTKMMKNKT